MEETNKTEVEKEGEVETKIETKVEKKVPELVINDNVVTLEVVEIPLIVNKEKTIIKLQQVSAGKRRELSKKYLQTKIQGKELVGSVDSLGFEIGILSKSIIEAPFTPTVEILSKFPDSILDYLYSQYHLNFNTEDEKKNN